MPENATTAVMLLTAPPPGAHGEEGPFTKVDGRECLLRCAELFVNREEVAQVLTTFPTADAEDLKRRFGSHLAFSGVKIGEPTDGWHQQIKALAPRLSGEITHVLVHDAARPAVAFTDLDALFEAAAGDAKSSHALALQMDADLVETDGEGHPVGYRPADAFRILLWPRIYPKTELAALGEGKEPPAQRLKLVHGLPNNIRCNRPADVKRLAAMIKLLPEPKREGPLSPFDEARW